MGMAKYFYHHNKENILALELFPNPAKTLLNISVTGTSDIVNIKVYNALGQIMDDFNIEDSRTLLNIDSYPRGIYYIGAEDKRQTTLKKFIKE